jgi:uncharacterized protein
MKKTDAFIHRDTAHTLLASPCVERIIAFTKSSLPKKKKMPVQTSYNAGDFCWVDLAVPDTNAAREFYRELFGWQSQDAEGGMPYVMFIRDGSMVAGMGPQPDDMKAQGHPAVWNSYISVEDAEATTRKAVELGGTVTMPAMQVMEFGSLAFIQDPTGAHVGLWQPGQHFGAQVTQDPVSLCWNELATRDVDKAKEFYGALFGWEFSEMPGSSPAYHVIKNQGADNGGIIQMDEKWGEAPPHWMVYFSVADVEATSRRVAELGAKLLMEPFDVPPVGRMCTVQAPQGAIFSVIQLNKPE